jgi:hypothetical protein
MHLRSETRSRLDYVGQALIHEFEMIPPALVLGEVDRATESLLAGATFDDFIPILAHRFAREQLRNRDDQSLSRAA